MKKLFAFSASLLFAASTWAISPQTGTWVITDELNGEPGRGIALDIQGNTLVMQVYAYKADGTSAFYLSAGQLSEDNRYEASLNEYQGGRFFGSQPLSGREVGSVGNVKLRFVNGITGYIQFPGEPERAFHRYQFKYGANPESLLGYWVTTATASSTLATAGGSFHLTKTLPASSTGTGIASNTAGTLACEFQRNANSVVICVNHIAGRPIRAYAFKVSVNEGFGVTYTTTSTGAQLGQSEVLTVKRLLTRGNQVVGLSDAYSDFSKSEAVAEFVPNATAMNVDLSSVLGFIADEVASQGLLNDW